MISVIIPVYDRTTQLKLSIDSILKQTYTDFEIIIVTDGSPKETLDVLKGYDDNSKIKFFHYFDNTGNAVRGRNKGIREAKGEYIAFQDSDDIAEPNRLELSLKYMQLADVVYGNWRVSVDAERNDLGTMFHGQEVTSIQCTLETLIEMCVPCNSTVMVKKSALIDVGCLKQKMQYREDHELWARLAFFGYKFKCIPSILTTLSLHDKNNELKFKAESEKWKNIVQEEYKEKNCFLPKIAYIIPGTGISGGIAVILKHCNLLLQKGYDVLLISQDTKDKIFWFENNVPIICINNPKKYLFENIDILVATGWTTVKELDKFEAKRKIYFVQSDERRFSDDQKIKQIVHNTYLYNCEYMTEARWIQKWLKQEFNQEASYVPNGLDPKKFYKVPQKQISKKIKILLEGPICIPFKGVEDAYNAVKDLECEIWFVSSAGKPKANWRYDKFFEAVDIDKMKDIYSSCDILLKMSRVEGFFGPPMEAMACGCAVVVAKCTGYDEYIVNEKNALVVDMADVQSAKKAIIRLMSDVKLRKNLISNGHETVKQWTWEKTLECLESVLMNKEVITQEKCDIIVVVHNALESVKKCIDSIKVQTKTPYNLIIVDNDSDKETKQYLQTIIDKNTSIITNSKNYGFGYANNIAIRKSKSKYVCFLNSDTIVTENWLSRLVEVFEIKQAGFVGPVTNFASSETQQIEFSNLDVQDFAIKRFNEFGKTCIETKRLIGFCMLTSKEVIDNIGVFDERFEFNFEDDDLCLRAIERGYKLYTSTGVFVYHEGGQSFKDRFKVLTHNDSLEKSRKQYVEKWYQTERINNLDKTKPKFSIGYLLASDSPSGGVKIVFEHANRLKDRGFDVKVFCMNSEAQVSWFDLHAQIKYITDKNIPYTDILIGTYFSTLPIVHKSKALIKLHLCQGYEALCHSEDSLLVSAIEDSYKLIEKKLVVSKWLKNIIDRKYNLNCVYVPNGIDNYHYSFKSHKTNSPQRILITGNYNLEIKGVSIAIKGVEDFLKQNEGSIVRLASEKTDNDDKYEFHNMSTMTQEEIAAVYESCDITVSASHKVEGFSLHSLESMASGTAVISTDNGGINDYAVNNENCILVPVNEPKAITTALQNIKSRNFVEQGLATAKSYLWPKQIDMLENTLTNLYEQEIDSLKEKISLCMIVKNEEEFLENCLNSVKNIVSEIIIVDTGSTDDTVKIAKKFGARIFHYTWNDDFSAARNFSLSKATQSWILVLDADETIATNDINKLKFLVSKEAAYSFITRNYVKSKNVENQKSCTGEYKEETGFIGWCPSKKVRLFLNKNAKFVGKVHELIEDANSSEIIESDIPIHHFGFQKNTIEKSKTYLKLGQEKLAQDVNNIKANYELAIQYMSLNNFDEALVMWRRLTQLQPENEEFYAQMGTTYNLLHNYIEAEKCFKRSLEIKPNDYAYKHIGICYAKLNNYQAAYEALKNVVYSCDDLKTLADYAFCCNELKFFDESICILEKCLKINNQETISWGMLEIAYNEKGIELVKKNRLKQSFLMFKSSLRINPDFSLAKNNLEQIERILKTGF